MPWDDTELHLVDWTAGAAPSNDRVVLSGTSTQQPMWQGDELIRLTSTEVQLMKIFSAQPHEPVSRSKLVEDLGRDRGQAQERAVDVQITRLRRKIEPNPKQPQYLQTVRGAGYMLAPD